MIKKINIFIAVLVTLFFATPVVLDYCYGGELRMSDLAGIISVFVLAPALVWVRLHRMLRSYREIKYVAPFILIINLLIVAFIAWATWRNPVNFQASLIFAEISIPMTYEFILCEAQYQPAIALIRLNRPKELNALNLQLMLEMKDALATLDEDENVRCIIITGNEQAFAAGADIKQMESRTPVDLLKIDQFETWDQIRKTKKPVIAAVSGFALGGGCELAMTCDMIVASESAKFGQPEIKIGIMPGAGGTQRLTRAIGKALAMEMVLTGRFISAEEAMKAGLINRIAPEELYLDEAVKLAKEVAQMSPVALRLAKESVLKAFDTGLQEGLYFERKNFYMCFASEDQKEGMKAFVEKRKPEFKGK